ncbi:MAG TPA: AAA family ATPase [Mycobacteriales bacterium]
MLHGRDPERAAIDGLLDGARRAAGGALVLRGEPGMGKTALLGYAAEHAAGMRVLRAQGVQAETQLSFAGLHATLRPVLSDMPPLPPPQAGALAGALGLAEARGQNRFLVAAGVLGLLGELAERQPVLCLVDDAHWLDGPSLDALLFAARRIEADPIAMVFTARTGEAELTGLPELTLGPIDPAAARALLLERAGAALGEAARCRVMAVAAGNPLALVELAAELATEPATPGADLGHLPLSARLERAFLQRVRDLPTEVQRLLLLAAADDSGDLGTVLAAAAALRIDPAALAAAERARLLRVDRGRVEFTHPLVRSAVYVTAAFADRQGAHRALAGVLSGEQEATRRAWHRAAAAVAPDENVAAELERAGTDARERAGHAVAAAALERAAALTGDPGRRARLLLDAAVDAWESGRADTASALVEQARHCATEPLVHARVDHLRGRFEARRGTVLDGYEILVAGADRIADVDPRLAAEMLVDALQAASYGGHFARIQAAGRRAERVLGPDGEPPAAAFVAGVGALLGGDPDRAVPLLRAVVSRAAETEDPVALAWAGTAAAYLGDGAAAHGLATRAAARCRTTGALGTLAYALEVVALSELLPSPAAAETHATEGLQLARETDQPGSAAVHLSLLAYVAAIRGDEEATVRHADEIAALAAKHGLGFPESRAATALTTLDLALGRPDRALDRLEALAATGHRAVALSSTPELVEAAVRVGRPERGRAAMDLFAGWATSSASPWSTAMLARCRALLSAGDIAAAHFEDALASHALGGASLDSARTQLLYGEFLRRERRRIEARPHLREALETFERLGATPWAERARAELRASGETARRRASGPAHALTPQERQIALFVASGATNKEIAAQLYVSPRTVDHHLRNVFSKLGITSRAQLRGQDLAG